MTATGPNITPPIPLRVYLDAGGVLDDLILEHIVEALVYTPVQRARAADVYRRDLVEVLDGTHHDVAWRGTIPTDPERGWGSWQQFASYLSWSAEVLEDPDLARHALESLPVDRRSKAERKLWNWKHPHPLVITETPDGDACLECGDRFEPAEIALTVGWQPDWSEEPDLGGGWCFGCVTIAYEAMKAAQR